MKRLRTDERQRQAALPAPAPTRGHGSDARWIARAAFELHASVGPAQATVSAVAERAGVERHTVYRHFPDIVTLIRACTQHGMEVTGLPKPDRWTSIADPLGRLRAALEAMYTYYRARRLIGNILRDLPVMPELVAGSSDYRTALARSGQRPGVMDAPARCSRTSDSRAGEHSSRVRDLAGNDGARRAYRRRGRRHDGHVRRGGAGVERLRTAVRVTAPSSSVAADALRA